MNTKTAKNRSTFDERKKSECGLNMTRDEEKDID